MKTTILRIISALLVLSVLWVNVPGVRADDGSDYVTEINQYVDQIYQDQKQTDDYINSITEQATQQPEAPAAVPQPAAPVARPVAVPQVKFQPVPQQVAMPQNPAAFQQMVLQNQARVRQQIMQTQQQIMQRSQQIIHQSQM